MQGHLTAEEWAELLHTRVLRPAEFDGIAVSRDTPGWRSIETAQFSVMDRAQLDALFTELEAKRQVIAGVLPADERYPVRIVTRQIQQTSQASRRKRRPVLQREAQATPSPKH
jgi:hypothetical protein